MLINKNDTAAIIVDYQGKLLDAMYNRDKLIKKSCILLQGLKEIGIPMYMTQQYTKGLGMTNPQIVEAAGLNPEDYTDKLRFSAYEAVADKITGKRYIIICGIESHICVLQTAIELKMNGYEPVLVADCVSSRTKKNYKNAVRRAKQEGILITSYEAILFELMGSATDPAFKAVSNLIK